MARRVIIRLFPRNRYMGASGGKKYYPKDRDRIARLLGEADRAFVHARVFDRSTSGALDFEVNEGCFGEEMPSDALRLFTVTLDAQSPSLPWNTTNMSSVPDDGKFRFDPDAGRVDLAASVSGAGEWVEFEAWITIELPG